MGEMSRSRFLATGGEWVDPLPVTSGLKGITA